MTPEDRAKAIRISIGCAGSKENEITAIMVGIQFAVAEERERCAKIVDNWPIGADPAALVAMAKRIRASEK